MKTHSLLVAPRLLVGTTTVLSACLAVNAALGQQTVRTYEVKYTSNAPTIDGTVGAGEWAAAAPAEGSFLLLRTNPPLQDFENTRWQAMWDINNLYILSQSDYFLWSLSTGGNDINAGINFGADNLNLYFDPNVDKEPNYPTNPETIPFDAVDGYQIAFNQWDGTSSFINGINNGLGGLFLEAHVDTLFGNQSRGQVKDANGNWLPYGIKLAGDGTTQVKDLPAGFAISQSNSGEGGVVEIAIPWSLFAAWRPDNPQNQNATPQDDVTGLYHPKAPANGDTWFFNIARISSDAGNQLPVWNWTPSQFFASHPHGEITFTGAPVIDLLPGDVNGDRKVDLVDFNILKSNFGKMGVRGEGDLTGDGIINLADFNELKTHFGTMGSTAVPEPATWLLAALATAGALVLGSRRADRHQS